MRTVNVAKLKDQLSKYLTFAKAGEEVVIRDRNLPVAKLVPFPAEDADADELRLVAAGKLRLPKEPLDLKALKKFPTGQGKGQSGDPCAARRPGRQVSKPLAFWDASALVPLCVREMSSRQAHIYIGKFSPVVWWASLVEVHSAICRLHRLRDSLTSKSRAHCPDCGCSLAAGAKFFLTIRFANSRPLLSTSTACAPRTAFSLPQPSRGARCVPPNEPSFAPISGLHRPPAPPDSRFSSYWPLDSHRQSLISWAASPDRRL